MIPCIDYNFSVEHLRRDLHTLAEPFAHFSQSEALANIEVHSLVISGKVRLVAQLLCKLIIRLLIDIK